MQTIKVTYRHKNKIDEKLDNKITKALAKVGFEWYAQGYDLGSGERDLCFDLHRRSS